MKTPQEWINENGLPDHYADQIRILADIQADARAELLERIEKLRKLVKEIDKSDRLSQRVIVLREDLEHRIKEEIK